MNDSQPSSSQSFDQLKEHVAIAIGQTCETSDGASAKVVEFVSSRTYKGVEPGVDLVDSLADLIRSTTGEAVRLGCDLGSVTKGITLGAFRARNFMRLEAHKVITHLAGIVVTATLEADGDLKKSIEGYLEGITQSAREMRLNNEEALFEASNAIVAAAKKEGRTITLRKQGGTFLLEEVQ